MEDDEKMDEDKRENGGAHKVRHDGGEGVDE